MITISLCMIVKNEERMLGRCLESVGEIADEIIIVDTGSTDDTISVAKKYTDKIFFFKWCDDFSAARNFSFSSASKDYILWLDADDIISEEDKKKFLALKETLPPDIDTVMLPYNVAFNSLGKSVFSYYRERIVRRASKLAWNEPVHEHLTIGKKVVQLDAAVSHMPGQRQEGHSDRNLLIYQKLINEGRELSSRGLFYYARELKSHGLNDKAIEQYEKFIIRDGIWKEDAISAAIDLSDCYMSKKDFEKALQVLSLSLIRDIPRAEVLCRIGFIYFQQGDILKSIFWYNLALNVPKPISWGFVSHDYYGYIPHMQLCMLHDCIGDHDEAYSHHKAAKALQPNSDAVAYNEAYFNKKLKLA